ncbi:transthyretin-like protein 2 precursor [Aphelenchoides avenae]|nr:transthyretin-like protein 2 precursor [Aphelenchus avenae]
MTYILLLCVTLCFFACDATGEGKTVEKVASVQKMTVSGQIACDGRTVPQHFIELRDHNKLTPDETMAEGLTDENGSFKICGQVDEFFTIVPYVRVQHECNVAPNCYRISDYYIPKGSVPGGAYHFEQVIDLHAPANEDETVCK